jgi:hypothetical protein
MLAAKVQDDKVKKLAARFGAIVRQKEPARCRRYTS